MDFWIILLALFLVAAVIWVLFGHYRGTAGGISGHSQAGRESTGQTGGASEESDRKGAKQKMSQHGAR
jgi:hypothetical protein